MKKHYLGLSITFAFLCSSSSTSAFDIKVPLDSAFGSNDPYMQNYYIELQQILDHKTSSWFKHLKPHNGRIAMDILQSCYENINTHTFLLPTPRIPKIIHQIWVGTNPFPEKYKQWVRTWQSMPGWTYKLWTDADVQDFPMINRELYYKEKNFGTRADILRLEILYREGGLYVDTDFECLRPELFEILNSSYDFYCGICPLDCACLMLNNAIIASIPGHPILEASLRNIKLIYEEIQDTNMSWSNAVLLKGPGLLTKMFLENANKGYIDIAFPPTFFYPLGVYQIENESWIEKFSAENFLKKVKKEVVRPETIAIHWWDGSWMLPAANDVQDARNNL